MGKFSLKINRNKSDASDAALTNEEKRYKFYERYLVRLMKCHYNNIQFPPLLIA